MWKVVKWDLVRKKTGLSDFVFSCFSCKGSKIDPFFSWFFRFHTQRQTDKVNITFRYNNLRIILIYNGVAYGQHTQEQWGWFRGLKTKQQWINISSQFIGYWMCFSLTYAGLSLVQTSGLLLDGVSLPLLVCSFINRVMRTLE